MVNLYDETIPATIVSSATTSTSHINQVYFTTFVPALTGNNYFFKADIMAANSANFLLDPTTTLTKAMEATNLVVKYMRSGVLESISLDLSSVEAINLPATLSAG